MGNQLERGNVTSPKACLSISLSSCYVYLLSIMPDYLLSFYVGETKEALRRFYMYLKYIYLEFCKALDTVPLNVFVTTLKICRLQMDSEQS